MLTCVLHSAIVGGMANNLPTEKKIMAISMLAEGASIRSVERINNVHRCTVMRLGVRIGQACAKLQDHNLRNIQSTDIEIDEIWGFIGKKKKQARAWEFSAGDVWTFIALAPDTKLIPAFH